jgi:uncharacterized membrane protein
MQFWFLFGVLVLGELFFVGRIPAALMSGSIPLHPLGWFGYPEYSEVRVNRTLDPAAYWLIVSVLGAAVVVIGVLIWMLAAHSMATAAP